MHGFGKYAALNQTHAKGKAQAATTKEMKDAGREVTDRGLERRDREQPVRKAEPPRAKPSAVEMSDLRPSRPMTADAWSFILPNGPAPGESERGYIIRRGTQYQHVREARQSALRQADAIAKTEGTESNPARRNKQIQAVLDRMLAAAEAKQAQASKDKDAGKGVEVGDD